jgi:hypothetical protein
MPTGSSRWCIGGCHDHPAAWAAQPSESITKFQYLNAARIPRLTIRLLVTSALRLRGSSVRPRTSPSHQSTTVEKTSSPAYRQSHDM